MKMKAIHHILDVENSLSKNSNCKHTGPPKMDFVMPQAQVSEKVGNALSLACLFKGTILPGASKTWSKDGGELSWSSPFFSIFYTFLPVYVSG